MQPAFIYVCKSFFKANTCLIHYNPCTLLPNPLLSLYIITLLLMYIDVYDCLQF
jgi:hypothetical protein